MAEDALFRARNLTKHFKITQGFFQKLKMEEKQVVRAVDGIDFDIQWKRNFSVVGESGCGKTTVGKLIMRLLEPTDGKMYMKDKDITQLSSKSELKAYRRQTQIIYQDPFSSLDPRHRVRTILEEPLQIHGLGDSREERTDMVMEALEEVRLTPPEKFLRRYPHMLSGGQKQRVSLARAMILSPDFIVADEPVSMLDVSVRAEVLNLMKDLIDEEDVTYFYITHDISTTRFFTDYIGVMYLGDMVEKGKVGDVLDNPSHPYTQALLVAVPEADPERVRGTKEVPISGEIPSGTNIPSGCRFHPRCPHAEEICSKKEPESRRVEKEHTAKCHFAGEIDFDLDVAK
ncbi:MAG: ABC transporter ATP-binding protein [Candidatus Thermoplasmatota archaeon]|nr:ABC transporter ATP-binding protein [Candidatus Thermoplasmatota archaeon]MBS3789627.1 ABC transporter ATP-binding protein [Candidatus Thermoplasmatota archaeon]